ncbi:hypothetical protein XENTR_v10019685 [Xenopus tropicalis]|nr:hypothetical protein XENTR_v10019685 [Xenopus tropicalis]
MHPISLQGVLFGKKSCFYSTKTCPQVRNSKITPWFGGTESNIQGVGEQHKHHKSSWKCQIGAVIGY